MGWFKKLKKGLSRIKLSKIQPGKLIKSAVNAAAAIGIPGAGTAARVVNNIGKRVDQINRVVAKGKEAIEALSREQGIPLDEAADRLAGSALTGAEAALNAPKPGTLLMAGGAIMLLFLLMRKR